MPIFRFRIGDVRSLDRETVWLRLDHENAQAVNALGEYAPAAPARTNPVSGHKLAGKEN